MFTDRTQNTFKQDGSSEFIINQASAVGPGKQRKKPGAVQDPLVGYQAL